MKQKEPYTTMPKIVANGIHLYYEIHGRGEPLILIMGLRRNSEWWYRQIPALSERFQVLAFDNRGAGRSDQPEEDYSMALFAEDTAALMQGIGLALGPRARHLHGRVHSPGVGHPLSGTGPPPGPRLHRPRGIKGRTHDLGANGAIHGQPGAEPRRNTAHREEDILTVVQPDISVVCDPTRLDEKGCLGAPDLIVEILSPATSRRDWKEKFSLYEEFGVREYWIVDPAGQTVVVFTRGADARFGRPEIYTA
jgi:hypothetical protein